MAVVVQVNFSMSGPWGAEMAEALCDAEADNDNENETEDNR